MAESVNMNVLGNNPTPYGPPPADVGNYPPSVNMNILGNNPNMPSSAPAPVEATPGLGGDPSTVYGSPIPAPGGGMAYPAYQPQPGGGVAYKGHTIKPAIQHPNLGATPTFPEYVIQEMLSTKDHNTTANMTDTDIMTLAEPFARQFAGMYNAQGTEMNKKEEDALVGKFKNKVFRLMPQLRQEIQDAEAQYRARMGAPPPGSEGIAGALGQRALGSMEAGAGSAAAGLPGVAANMPGMILPPAVKALADKFAPNALPKLSESIRSGLNPLIAPGAAELKKAGQEKVASTDEALKEHPYLAATSEVLGGVAPYLGLGAVTGAAGPALYGMSEMGGASLEKEQNRINSMKPEELNALPEYQTLLKTTGDPNKAKDLLAKASSEAAEEVGQIMGGVMGTIGGGGMTTTAQKAIAKAVGTSTLKRVLATAGVEAGGFAGQQAVQNVLTAKATNKATGEQREPDTLADTNQAGIMGAVMGAIGALLHGKGRLGKAAEAEPTANREAGVNTYNEVLNHPEYKLPENASPDVANETLANALDELQSRLAGHGMSEEEINNAKTRFEAEWRKNNNQPVPITEGAQPSTTEAGAATTTPAATPATPTPAARPSLLVTRLQRQRDAIIKAMEGVESDADKKALQHTIDFLDRQIEEFQPKRLTPTATPAGGEGVAETAQPTGAEGAAAVGAGGNKITRTMAIELKSLGFTDEQINTLTWEQAWDHINGKAGPEAMATTGAEGVPVMITQAMKAELKANGFTDEGIAKLTPQDAHDILNKARARRAASGIPTPGTEGAAESASAGEGAVPGVGVAGGPAEGGAAPVEPLGQATGHPHSKPAAPGPEPDHHIVTHPDVDVRHPLGLLKAALKSFRTMFKREPTREELERQSNMLAKVHGIDIINDPDHDVNRREALGELLEANPDASPSPGELTKKAGEYFDQANKRTAHSVIAERHAARDNHPIPKLQRVLKKTNQLMADKAKKEAEQKEKERLEDEKRAKEAADEVEYNRRQEEYQRQLPKVESELTAEQENAALEEDLKDYKEMLEVQRKAEHEAKLAEEHAAQVKADLEKSKVKAKSGNVLKQTLAEKKVADKKAALVKSTEAKAKQKKAEADAAKKRAQSKAADIKKEKPSKKNALKKPTPAAKKPVSKKGEAGAAAKTKTAKPKAKFSAGIETEPVVREGGYYSRLSKALQNSSLKFSSLTANAWKRWLNDAESRGDIKKSERQWLGIDQWLDRQGGEVVKGTGKDNPTVIPKISVRDLQDFIDVQKLHITAETRTAVPPVKDLPRNWYTKYGKTSETWEVRDENNKLRGESEVGGSEDDAIEDALAGINSTRGLAFPPTGESAYLSTPGGTNHKEQFLTLPKKQRGRNFISPHFDNVVNSILHVRTNERTTTNGKKMLFADEIQNDWARVLSDYEGIFEREIKGWTAVESGPKDVDGVGSYAVYNPDKVLVDKIIAKSPEKAIEYAVHSRLMSNGIKQPPSAPFRNPSDYFLLGFKHLLREAVDSGKDTIGWTTGDQQVDRYGLSKKVYSIKTEPLYRGENLVTVRFKNNENISFLVDNKSGKIIDGELVGKDLNKVVGDELAKKIMGSEEEATFEGKGLDLGGQFHRNLYDNIGPKAINDYVKQWGGEVKTSEIHTREGETEKVHSVDITPEMRKAIQDNDQPMFAPAEGAPPVREARGSGIRESLSGQFTNDAAYLQENMRESLAILGFKDADKARYEQIRNESLSPQLRKVIEEWSNAIGHKIVVYRNLTPEIETFKGVNFGNKTLYVNEATKHPATTIASHEFIHQLRVDNPELYNELAAEVKRQGKIREYEKWLTDRNYKGVDTDLAIEELTANGTADAFTDEKFLNELAKRNPTVFGRIVDAFMKFLNTILDRHGDMGSKDFLSDVDAFRSKLLDVLEKYKPEKTKIGEGKSEVKFASRGPTVTTAAEAMEAAKDWTRKKPTIVQSFKSWKDAPDSLKPTLWQKVTQKAVNTLKPLEYYNEHQARQGHKVDPKADMLKYFTVLRGRQIFEQSTDHSNYIQPILDAVRNMAAGSKMTDEETMGMFSQWIRAKDAIESNKRYELENIKLTPEAESKRAPLLLSLREGKLKGNYMEELQKIVHAPGAKLEPYVEPISGMTSAEARQTIKAVNDAGFSNASGESLNKSFDKLRERIIQNQLRSNSITDADVRQIKGYENRYYMPKSDWADEDIRVPKNVFGSPLGHFTKSSYGDKPKLSDDPVQRIFNKLLFSAKDVADNEATEALWHAARDPNQKLGATIRTYDMDKLAADAIRGGKSLANMQKVAAGRNSVIHNRGQYRDVITLPEDSPQLQAIKESQHPVELGGISSKVAKATGLYGRVHTALSPAFALVNAVVRDGLYLPGMMVFQGRMDLIPGYIGNYMKFGGPMGAWKSAFTVDGGLRVKTFAEAEKYAIENPDSYAGHLYQLEKAGGGFNFRDSFNNAKKIATLVEEMERNRRGPFNAKRWASYLGEMQDAIATGSMMAGRVAAFASARAKGMSITDAAFYAKRFLDYQQTSQGSRMLNSWYAFSRVGVTSVDAMFSALKNEQGYIDHKRAAVGMMIMGTATASAYAALKSMMGDDKAKQLSDDALAKNVLLPFGDGDPIQLPIGLGMPRLAWGVAMLATRLAEGDTTAQSAGRTLKNLLAENVSPLHPIETKEGADSGTIAADLAGALVPSVARPGYESFLNQTAFGSEIHEKPAYTQGYASEAARATTGKWYTDVVRALRETVGLDMYPETLRHLMSSYDPGIVSLFFKHMEKEDMETAGLDVDSSQATIFAGLFNHDLKYATGKEYYQSKQNLEQARKEKDFLEKQGKTVPSAIEVKADLDKEFVKASKEHSKERRAITDNPLLGTVAKASRLAALQSKWTRTQADFARQAQRLEH